MTIPTAPELDLTLAKCPKCDAEGVEVVSDLQPKTQILHLNLHCSTCNNAAVLGYATRHSSNLFPWVLTAWGVPKP